MTNDRVELLPAKKHTHRGKLVKNPQLIISRDTPNGDQETHWPIYKDKNHKESTGRNINTEPNTKREAMLL